MDGPVQIALILLNKDLMWRWQRINQPRESYHDRIRSRVYTKPLSLLKPDLCIFFALIIP
jgi:hypothetical protein